MSKDRKKIYTFLAWFFSVVVAAGTLIGCAMKYGAPPASGYNTIQKDAVEKDV